MWERLPVRLAAVAFGAMMVLSSDPSMARDRTTHHLPGNQPLWEITQQWDDAADRQYSEWVARLGMARKTRVCLRFKACLNNPIANSLWEAGEKWKHIFADCADLPYVMRAYFAYKTGRPFQFTSVVSGSRYTPNNRVRALSDFTDPYFKDTAHLLRLVAAWTHSGYFRTRPELEDTDTYPVDVTRQTVVPGTVFYEPRGHVLVVVQVNDDGTVHMIDGHPDNSLTYKVMTPKSCQPGRRAKNGGGFRAWRRYTYSKSPSGAPVFHREANADILSRAGGYDHMAQYQKAFYVLDEKVTYWQWVRARLTRQTNLSAVSYHPSDSTRLF